MVDKVLCPERDDDDSEHRVRLCLNQLRESLVLMVDSSRNQWKVTRGEPLDLMVACASVQWKRNEEFKRLRKMISSVEEAFRTNS